MREHRSHRRLVLLLVPALLAASAAAASGDLPPDLRTYKVGEDWPRFLGPTLDGKSSESGLRLDWPEGGPPLVWDVEAGTGYSMVSTSRGRLFLFDRHADSARLRCLRSETGEELWRREYPTSYEDMYGFSNGPKTTPVVDADRVYTFGVEGRLRCHRVTDGELLWDVDTGKEFGVVQNFFGVGSTPIVEGDRLIALVGGSPPGSPGVRTGDVRGHGSGIVAFDKRTGKVLYKATDELASYSSPIVVDVGGRRLGLVFARGGLVGFDPATGKPAFRFPWRARKIESVNASNPVVVGDRVFFSESYGPGSALLRLGDGEPDVVWKDPPRGKSLETHWMTPIHHDGVLYGSSGSGTGDAELRAVEFATGKVLWKEPGLGRSTLLYVDRHLIVLTEHGRLLVLPADPEGFRPVADVVVRRGAARAPNAAAADGKAPDPAAGSLIRYPAWNPPVLSHGLLHVRGKDRLVTLSLRK